MLHILTVVTETVTTNLDALADTQQIFIMISSVLRRVLEYLRKRFLKRSQR
jgi:hypothetical protein